MAEEPSPIKSTLNEEIYSNKIPETIVNVMLVEDKNQDKSDNKVIVTEKANDISDKIPDVVIIEDKNQGISDVKQIENNNTKIIITENTPPDLGKTNQVVVKETIIINKDSESIEYNTPTQEIIDLNVKASTSNCDVENEDKKSLECCLNTVHNPRPSGILISLPKKSINSIRPEIRNSKQSGINISFHKSVSRIKNQPDIEDNVNMSTIQNMDMNKDDSANKSNKKVGRIKKAFLNLRSKLKKLF